MSQKKATFLVELAEIRQRMHRIELINSNAAKEQSFINGYHALLIEEMGKKLFHSADDPKAAEKFFEECHKKAVDAFNDFLSELESKNEDKPKTIIAPK